MVATEETVRPAQDPRSFHAPPSPPPPYKPHRAYRAFGIISAVLFGLFATAGIVGLVSTLPSRSCSGVNPTNYGGDTVQLAGSEWNGIPSNHCVEVVTATGQYEATSQGATADIGSGFDDGPAPTQYSGDIWEGIRFGVVAWILWTAAMMFLAAAVAALPGSRRPPR
jgi:hypothetical protein